MTTLYFDVGENKASRTYILHNGPLTTSTPVDLTTASTVVMFISDGFPSATKTCTFVADATGSVTVELENTDLTVSGQFRFKTRVTFADSTVVDLPKPGFDYLAVGTVS